MFITPILFAKTALLFLYMNKFEQIFITENVLTLQKPTGQQWSCGQHWRFLGLHPQWEIFLGGGDERAIDSLSYSIM